MPWARASSLHRFLECPAASWLPRWDDGKGTVAKPYLQPLVFWQAGGMPEPVNRSLLVKRDKRAADLGRAAHARVEQGEWSELYKGVDPDGHHEASVSYCCKTGRMRWVFGLDERRRDLWKAMQCEHAVVGTADWVGRVGGR